MMRALFNPLLLAQGVDVVPCDLATMRHDMTVIVTGPNSGGKTRLLQSVAIAQMLGQCGFFVPAREAVLGVAPGLFVSLIEEATADQSEGRLGMELIRIRSLFEKLRVGAMVVLDELCSGTNPSEGEEIFELVISLLGELGPQAFITTHFLQLAARIAAHPPVPKLAFFQVELDQHQFPTYRFVPGVAQTSLAHRTAARLGVTREELLALIEANKRAYRSREEDDAAPTEQAAPKVSADHKVRASATEAPSK
jgi:DNA mismatch repair protein MutS2